MKQAFVPFEKCKYFSDGKNADLLQILQLEGRGAWNLKASIVEYQNGRTDALGIPTFLGYVTAYFRETVLPHHDPYRRVGSYLQWMKERAARRASDKADEQADPRSVPDGPKPKSKLSLVGASEALVMRAYDLRRKIKGTKLSRF